MKTDALRNSMRPPSGEDELLPLRPLRQCICCEKSYDRTQTSLFQPVGIFENYCLCNECLSKERQGWARNG